MRIFNYANLKDYRWDSEILGLVAQIHEFKGKQELYLKQKPATLEKLVEIAKIQSTEASNKIEGIVTTSTRLQQLVMEKTTPKNRDEEDTECDSRKPPGCRACSLRSFYIGAGMAGTRMKMTRRHL